MAALRPFLFAILGAFVAAAPAAPVPWRAKKERKSGGAEARGHYQKLEEPEKQEPTRSFACGTPSGVATGSERSSDTGGDVAPADDDRALPLPDPAVATARPPTGDSAAPRPADLCAGLLDLPPPRARRST